MIKGPRAATAQVKVKLGGMTTSGIIIRSSLETLRSATGVVDSRRYKGLSDQPSKLSGVEATFNAVDVCFESRLGEAVKAVAAEQREKRRAIFIAEGVGHLWSFQRVETGFFVVDNKKDCAKKASAREEMQSHDRPEAE
jgi:hypothetical protein